MPVRRASLSLATSLRSVSLPWRNRLEDVLSKQHTHTLCEPAPVAVQDFARCVSRHLVKAVHTCQRVRSEFSRVHTASEDEPRTPRSRRRWGSPAAPGRRPGRTGQRGNVSRGRVPGLSQATECVSEPRTTKVCRRPASVIVSPLDAAGSCVLSRWGVSLSHFPCISSSHSQCRSCPARAASSEQRVVHLARRRRPSRNSGETRHTPQYSCATAQ